VDNSTSEKLEHRPLTHFVVRIRRHAVERIMFTGTLCYVAFVVKVRGPTVIIYVIDFFGKILLVKQLQKIYKPTVLLSISRPMLGILLQ